jgi:hypothetical protein
MNDTVGPTADTTPDHPSRPGRGGRKGGGGSLSIPIYRKDTSMPIRTIFVGFVLAFLWLLSSCKEQSVIEPDAIVPQASIVTLRNVPADTGAVGVFTFVSLRDSAILASSDSNTMKWDLAFRTTTIRVNCGASGPGQGGAIVLTSSDFDTLSSAPATGYRIDSSTTSLAIPTGSGNGWYNYNPSMNIIIPIPGVVLVIRTGEGKYAKVQIQSYYRNAPTVPTASDKPRCYTFRYYYQSDGSTKLR